MKTKIPLWINILQVLLILIMLSQVYLFYLDHDAVLASGITIESIPDKNLLYEFAGRTATMAIVSIVILFLQDVKLFVIMFLMNVLRELQETIIDPLYPLANAPMSPTGDLIMHIIIVAIELFAFIRLYQLLKKSEKNTLAV
jgi:hypothetical protein